MSFKRMMVAFGLIVSAATTAFTGMLVYPDMLPNSWAAPSVSPPNLSAEEVDANCCERIKFGKWQAVCGCEADGQRGASESGH